MIVWKTVSIRKLLTDSLYIWLCKEHYTLKEAIHLEASREG